MGIYTVPADKTLYITSVYVNIDSDKRANIALYTVANIDNVTPPTSPKMELIKLDYIKNYREKILKSYMKIEEKTDIWFRGVMDSNTNSSIDVHMEYLLVDN